MTNQRQPFYPWPERLRDFGFKKSYILKDLFYKKKLAELKISPGMRVLDVGCGQGVFLDRLIESYRVRAVGVDIVPEIIGEAKRKSKRGQFMVADALNLPFSSHSFDLVISLDTLEHIDDQNRAMREMVRVLKDGGVLFIYVLSKKRQFTFNRLQFIFFKFLGWDLQQKFGHQPKLFLEEEKIKDFAKKNKIKILSILPFHSFFTNFFDFILLTNFWLFSKLGFFRSEKLGKMVLTFGDIVCRLVYYPLWILDFPWRIFGQGNGLLFVGRKDNEET